DTLHDHDMTHSLDYTRNRAQRSNVTSTRSNLIQNQSPPHTTPTRMSTPPSSSANFSPFTPSPSALKSASPSISSADVVSQAQHQRLWIAHSKSPGVSDKGLGDRDRYLVSIDLWSHARTTSDPLPSQPRLLRVQSTNPEHCNTLKTYLSPSPPSSHADQLEHLEAKA
ncbi:hypothetical protein C0989_005240, partial [Termitomyces sp. Mn162]